MKTQNKSISKFLIFSLIFILLACSKDEPNIDPTSCTDCGNVYQVIAAGGPVVNFGTQTEIEDIAGTEETKNETYIRKDSTDLNEDIEQRWVCVDKEVNVLGGTDENPVYDPGASVIWPGNLLEYKTLNNGTPTDISVKRAGGTITYNLNVGNLNSSETVTVIDQGSVSQAMNTIIESHGDFTPADFSLEVVAVNSNEQLALEMGLQVKTLGTKVKSSFSLDSKQNTSSVLVKLKQRYYTMSYVKPTSLEDFFDPSVTPEQLSRSVQPGNPATYISSVTYGRVFYMLYESTASAEDMKLTLEGSYKFVGGKASGEANIEKLREYNELSVKVIAYGGDSEGTLNAVGSVFGGENAIDNLQDIIERLAKAGDIRGGKPLSYVVNLVENPSEVVTTNLATTYTIRNCELKGILPPPGYKTLFKVFKTEEDEGGIGAMFQVKDSDLILFNKAGTRYAWFNGNTSTILGIFEIDDPAGPMGVVPFEAIGATTRFENTVITVFDKEGLNLSTFIYDPSLAQNNSLPAPQPIGTFSAITSVNEAFGSGDRFPFANQGIVAGSRHDLRGRKIMFSANGTKYSLYNSITNSWENTIDTNNFQNPDSDPNETGQLFDAVGASSYISYGGSGRTIFINSDGDELMEFDVELDRFYGPWVIN
jgi:thiol-activated cytolysin